MQRSQRTINAKGGGLVMERVQPVVKNAPNHRGLSQSSQICKVRRAEEAEIEEEEMDMPEDGSNRKQRST